MQKSSEIIHHHTGGLEITRKNQGIPTGIHHHTGGLEMLSLLFKSLK
ncbi:hypothetical protein BAZOLSSOX_317 [uncultured Gammaproteobacteria bacterium]|nr:hypothetical protein BAZOLSSOX_317 [uncultured Gammaproteobacteria bacterium]